MKTYLCNYCDATLSKGNKAKHERTKKHLKNKVSFVEKKGSDLQTLSSKLPNFPWSKYNGEHHLPGFNFLGPGTRLDIRLDENDVPKPGEEPINRVDAAALKHDLAYKSKDLQDRHVADVHLIHDLNKIGKIPDASGKIKNPTLVENISKNIAKAAMKVKLVLGAGTQDLIEKENVRLANELHKEHRNNRKYLKVKVFNKDDIWSADLIETVNVKNNLNYRYILTIIDLYTRFAWAIPLLNKKAESVKVAFENLFESDPNRIPRKLYVDNGKEFYNKIMEDFLKENDIDIYSTFNQPDERSQGPSHNPVIERFNRTLKSLMYKKFTERGNRIWVDVLPDLINFYNNKIHSSIGVTPTEASENPKLIQEVNLNNNNFNENMIQKQKFNVNDKVRIFKWKNKFEKGVTYSWTKEIFKINKIYNTKPYTYKILDLHDEEILGRFYAHELQKTSF